MFFKVFQCFSGFLSSVLMKGRPRDLFHSLISVKGGWYFSILKAK